MTAFKPADTITLLQSDKPLAKQVIIGDDIPLSVKQTKVGFLFDVVERCVSGLNELHALLQDLQHDQYAAVIRGRLIEGMPTKAVRRTTRDRIDSPRNFEPCSRQWLMVDIDWYRLGSLG